jgi:putative FmdB family regulatory protein
MPIYEYCCTECGERFDRYLKVGQKAELVCPECGARARKVFRPVGIIFKGSGFYTTDYRDPKDRKPEEAGKPAAAKSEAGKESD